MAAAATSKIRGSLSSSAAAARRKENESKCLIVGIIIAILGAWSFFVVTTLVVFNEPLAQGGQLKLRTSEPEAQATAAGTIVTDTKVNTKSLITGSQTLLLTMPDLGQLKIVLRPEFSSESVQYVKDLIAHGCKRCKFYRAEEPGILQGIMAHPSTPIVVNKGTCPAGYSKVNNDCPAWDQNCDCHGPVMERGMVGWAAGATGPDFFIDAYSQSATWWGTQHTVFGQIQDNESFRVIDTIWTLPVNKGDLTYLKQDLHFTMELL
jgi:cyclophilin family peptidyl-prolyl cis-trans isomerase